MDTLIANVTAVTMVPGMEVLFGAYIGIDGGKIVSLSRIAPKEAPKTIIDGTGMVAIPGLINCHTRLTSTALRCYTDDLPAAEALTQQLNREEKLDPDGARAAATVGIAECLRFGVTSVSDLSYYPDPVARACADAGIKANISYAAFRFIDENEEYDFEQDEQGKLLERITDAWHGHDNGRLKIDAGIFAEYTSNYPLWEALAGFASEKKLGMQLRLAQTRGEVDSCLDRTGMEPAALLDCHRLFAVPACAAGCSFLSGDDARVLARRHCSVVALPLANAKNGQPCPDIPALVKSGLNVALGTDGAPECGNLDMFEVMRGAAMAMRTRYEKPDAFPANAALMMATVCGAQAQGRADECGMLKVGLDADIVLVDFTAPHLLPCHNVLSGLVFAAKGGDVAMTMVRGRVLYQNGRFPTLDLNAAVKELSEHAIARMFADDKKDSGANAQ